MRGRGSDSAEFIREVDEAVRQDRWLALWKRYGALAVGATLAVVVGVSAAVGWRSYLAYQEQEQARRYAAASQLLTDDKPAEAADAFKALADDAIGGMAVIARLRAAQALGEAGDLEGKKEALAAVEGDSGADPLFQSLASLLHMQASFDGGDPGELADRIEQTVDDANPWHHSFMELKALAEIQAGRIDAARATLEALVDDPTTPAGLARRASELLQSQGGPLESDNQTVSQTEKEVER